MIGYSFHEIMEGTVQKSGERFDRPFRFELDVNAPDVLGLATSSTATAAGTARIDGLAKDVPVKGRMELSPLRRHTIRYVFDFTGDDGKKYSFDGSKSTTVRRHIVGWTTLPGKVFDQDGNVWGDAVLRYWLRRDLPGLVRSIRLRSA